MTEQLALPLPPTPEPGLRGVVIGGVLLNNPGTAAGNCWADTAIAVARTAVSPQTHPGYREFTTGHIAVTDSRSNQITITTDNPWAASVVRTALLDAGHATDSDPAHTSTDVTVWSVRVTQPSPTLALTLTASAAGPETDGRFLLAGPDGVLEQQYGAGGRNDLIAHAPHPHPGAVQGVCQDHGPYCFTRRTWPHQQRARHLLNPAADSWRMTDAAEQRMRDLYTSHLHSSRPDGGPR